MDEPYEETQFKFTGTEYVLPGSSRFGRLLYGSPRELENRFFSIETNVNHVTCNDKRSVLTLAFVQYLTKATNQGIISPREKDRLLDHWKHHPDWPSPPCSSRNVQNNPIQKPMAVPRGNSGRPLFNPTINRPVSSQTNQKYASVNKFPEVMSRPAGGANTKAGTSSTLRMLSADAEKGEPPPPPSHCLSRPEPTAPSGQHAPMACVESAVPSRRAAWVLPAPPTGGIDDMTFDRYAKMFGVCNSLSPPHMPWDHVIQTFKEYIFCHFGPNTRRHVSTALTKTSLRDHIPPGVIQEHVRQLVFEARGNHPALLGAEDAGAGSKKRERSPEEAISLGSKVPRYGVSRTSLARRRPLKFVANTSRIR